MHANNHEQQHYDQDAMKGTKDEPPPPRGAADPYTPESRIDNGKEEPMVKWIAPPRITASCLFGAASEPNILTTSILGRPINGPP